MKTYDEKQRQIYLRLIEAGVTKSLLKENEEFVLRKRIGYQEFNELTFPTIAQLYYEAGYSEKLLASSRMSQIFCKAVFKIDSMLEKYSLEKLIQYFTINSLEDKKKYIKYLCDNKSLNELSINFLNLPIRLEHKLNKYGFFNLDDLVNAESYSVKKVLKSSEFSELKNKLKELGLNFKGALLLEKKIEELTDEEKKNINISDLFKRRTIYVLQKNYVYTIGDLLKMSYSKLYTLSYLGKSSLYEIMEKLHLLGYKLMDEEEFIYSNKDNLSFNQEIKKLTEDEKKGLTVRTIFSSGISRLLVDASIYTIEDLLKIDCKDLIKFKGFGAVKIKELIRIINNLGFHLKGEEEFLDITFNNQSFESIDSLNEEIKDLYNMIEDKCQILLEYRQLLEEYKKVKIEEEILDYQLDCVVKELNNLRNRGKKYGKK